MKKIICVTLIGIQFANAMNLAVLRKNSELYSVEKATASSEEVKLQIQSLRKKLFSSSVNYSSLQDLAKIKTDVKSDNSMNLLSFSSLIKGELKLTADRISSMEKYQAPVLITSTASVEKLRRDKRNYESEVCNVDMNRTAEGLSIKLLTMAIDSKNKANEINSQSMDLGNKLLEVIRKAPTFQGKDLTHLFGDLKKVEIFDGIIRELHFSRADLTVEISLPMLITLRTGMDNYYLKALNCLLDYFKEQEFLFQKKLDFMGNSPNSVVNFMLEYDKIAKASQGQAINKEDLKEKLNSLDIPELTYNKRIKKFYEGKKFSSLSEEKSFLSLRLDRIRGFIGYLESKVKNSEKVHQRISKMTKEQQNYLIDLFIQLQGENIMSSIDKEVIINELKSNKTTIDKNSLNVTFAYQTLISDQIASLSQFLDNEKNQESLTLKDRNILMQIKAKN